MSLWTTDQISTIAAEAEYEIAENLHCITKRVAVNTIAFTSLYNVPDDVIAIRRVTWLGKKLEPLAFRGLLQYPVVNPAGSPAGTIGAFNAHAFSTAFFVVSAIGGSDSLPESGTPYAYFYSGYGENIIKFFPTPNVNVADISTDLFGTEILNRVIIEYYAFPDLSSSQFRLPQYVARRIIKAYSLYKILSIEGPGQDLVGSTRHKQRYLALMKDFRMINAGVFVSRQKTRSPNANTFAVKIARPRLPSNFGNFAED